GVGVPGQRRRGGPERLEHPRPLGRRHWEGRLQHRLPPLQAIVVHLAEQLDVQEVVADLDVPVARREEVELVTAHDLGRGQRREGLLGGPQALPEGAPLPALDDRGHGGTLHRSSPNLLVMPPSYAYRDPAAPVIAPRAPTTSIQGSTTWL